MGILGRYIITEFLRLLLPMWLSLGFLLFMLEWLAQVFRIHAPPTTVLLLYLYKAPSHLQLVFPVSVLLTALLVLGGMNRSREVVAVQSVGVNMRQLFLPCFIAIGLAGVLNYAVVNHLSPWGMRKHYELMDEQIHRRPSRFSQIRQEKIWYRNKDVLYNVRYFAPEQNELFDVTIYTFDDDFHIVQTVFAEKAKWREKREQWELSNVTVNIVDKRLSDPVSKKGESKFTALIEAPSSLKRIDFNAETMSQNELARAIRRHRALGINTNQWEVVYHSRNSFFLISFIFLMLAFPVALKFRRVGSKARDGVFVAAVSLTYWMIFSYGANLGNAGKLNPAVAAWAPSLLFVVLISLYLKSQKLKSTSD